MSSHLSRSACLAAPPLGRGRGGRALRPGARHHRRGLVRGRRRRPEERRRPADPGHQGRPRRDVRRPRQRLQRAAGHPGAAARRPGGAGAGRGRRAHRQPAQRRGRRAAGRRAGQRAARRRDADANQVKLDQTQSVLDNFAADLFQGGGAGSQMSVALGATSADDFATRVVLADQVTSLTDNALKELQNARSEASAQAAYVTAVKAEVTQLKHDAEAALATAQAARTAATAAKTNLDNLLAQQYDLRGAGRVRRRPTSCSGSPTPRPSRPSCRRPSRRRRGPRPRPRPPGQAAAKVAGRAYTPVTGGTGFLMHAANGPITSPFGMRFHPILHVYKLHSGTDFGVPVRHPGRRGRRRHRHQRRLRRRQRQPHRHRPRHRQRRRPRLDLQPPHLVRRQERPGQARPAHRLLRHDRLLHRLPPALRDARERAVRQPDEVAVAVRLGNPAPPADVNLAGVGAGRPGSVSSLAGRPRASDGGSRA